LPLKGNNIWGIYSGTLGENYDLKTLVCAASKLEKLHPNLIILVAGRGPLEEYIEAAAHKCNNLFYIGSLPTNKLYQLFSYCDFGFSTYSEASTVSMPVKSYDYFAAGLPLVNSLNRNLGQLIKKYNLGFQYAASDCESLVNTIINLMENVELLQEQKQNCLEISKFFDEEQQYNKIITIVQDLL
jgi:glycosyltransferase involved in cell wall biosynthesis